MQWVSRSVRHKISFRFEIAFIDLWVESIIHPLLNIVIPILYVSFDAMSSLFLLCMYDYDDDDDDDYDWFVYAVWCKCTMNEPFILLFVWSALTQGNRCIKQCGENWRVNTKHSI